MSELPAQLLKRMQMSPSLADCERMIESAQVAYVQAGQALAEIRDRRLYKKTNGGDYSSFDAYCRERWNWDRTYVHRQIEAAEIYNTLCDRAELLPNGNTFQLPRTEAAARELRPLKNHDQLDGTWTEVLERHGPDATAGQIRKVVREVAPDTAPKRPPAPERDLDAAVKTQRRLLTSGYTPALLREALDAIDPDGGHR